MGDGCVGAGCVGAGCVGAGSAGAGYAVAWYAAEELQRRSGASPDGSNDFWDLTRADDRVDLGDLFLELVAVALGEAAGDDETLAGAVFLQLRHLEDRVDRLLLGGVDER